MKRGLEHDQSLLWAYAARELGGGEERELEEHLHSCPECRDHLASVQVAREALDGARGLVPQVGWNHVDEAVGALVERRLAAQARRPMLIRLGLASGLALVSAAVVAVVLLRPEPVVVPQPLVQTATPPRPMTARVDRAEGLMRVGQTSALLDGAELRSGDVLATTKSGKAFVHLPDLSHLRVAGGTQLTLTRTDVDDVALALERGRVAVRASHQDRKGFVVHSGGLTVHVVGTVFAVTTSTDATEVAVSEGRVRVEVPGQDDVFVGVGERLRLDTRGRTTHGKLTPALTRELDEVTAVGDAATAVETQAVVAAAGGQQSAPPLLAAQGTPRTLPRLDSKEARARQVSLPNDALAVSDTGATPRPEAPVVQRIEPKVDVVIEEPPAVWPSMAPGGGATFTKREALPTPAPDATEWAALPTPEPAPAPPLVEAKQAKLADEAEPAARSKPFAKDLESIFMEHAEASLGEGSCDRFLVGLEEIAQDAQHTQRTELARIFRARCFNLQLRPRQAINEYRKYLEEYPRGRFVEEARDAIGP